MYLTLHINMTKRMREGDIPQAYAIKGNIYIKTYS